MKKLLFIIIVLLIGCEGFSQSGWRKIECYDQGKLVYQAEDEQCPQFAGTGYAKLADGKIIKGECVCRQ